MSTQKPTIQPTGNYLLLERVVPEDSTVIRPDTAELTGDDVIVRAIGPKVEGVAIGDSVMLRPNANLLHPSGQPNLGLCDAGSVVAVLR